MILIKVELWPGGDANLKRDLGQALIYNDGRGTLESGDYQVRLYKWGKSKSVWKTGSVKDFPRKRLGPWDLLYRALKEIVGDRN